MLLQSPWLLLLSAFFLLLLKMLVIQKAQKNNLPPGPWKLPVVGSFHHLPLNALTHRTFHNLAMKYGRDLFHLKLGQANFVVASSRLAAGEILKTHDHIFASRPTMFAIKTIAYDSSGLGFSPFGHYWRQLRKTCAQELLGAGPVRSFGFIRDELAQKLVQNITSTATASPAPVNLTELFVWVSNGYITRAAFGGEYCAGRRRLTTALKETVKLLPLLRLADLFPAMRFTVSVLDGSRMKMKRLRDELDEVLDEIIEEHRAKKGEEDDEEEFVDVLLRIEEKGELKIPFSMDNVKAVILDMLLGATETTSSTMEWVMSELIRHPEVMQKTQLGLREDLRGKTSIEEGDMNKLQFLKRVIKETLRLHPPLPLLFPRTCSESTELLGFTIPANSWVVVNAWAIGRDPAIWEDPESFRPERFEGLAMDFKGNNYEYIPFGAGRRICPGVTFAMAAVELFLSVLLLNFDWKLPDGRDPNELDMDEELSGSSRRKNDLLLLPTLYDPHKK